MLSDSDRLDLLREVVSEVVGAAAQAEWLAPGQGWSAHVRLRGVNGFVGYLLTSPEWQEARFEEPHYSTFLIADGDDADFYRRTMERLARLVAAYLSGAHEVEHRPGIWRTRTTLVVRNDDGVWRIGRRLTRPPRFEN